MNKKIVVFDWGGVINAHDKKTYSYQRGWEEILKRLNAEVNIDSIDKVNELIIASNNKCLDEICKDEDIEEWCKRFCEKFKINYYVGFREDFEKIYKEEMDKCYYYSEVINFIKSIKDKCEIGVLSNCSVFTKDRLRKIFNYDEDVNYYWLSCELETGKPYRKIYEIVERNLDRNPSDILFIDDVESNLVIPNERGWKTYHAQEGNISGIKNVVNNFLNE